MDNLFFELIHVAVDNCTCLSHTPSAKEWKGLYSLAYNHALLGVCFRSLNILDKQEQLSEMPLQLKMHWLGMAVQIQKRNELINQRCVELQRMLGQNGFRTYIMKGQGNATLYNNVQNTGEERENKKNCLSSLRQPGDIDIYLEGGYKRVMEYVNRTFPTKEVNELEIHYHCFKDSEVEIHYKPFVIDGPKNIVLQQFFTEESEACFKNWIPLDNSGNICIPTITFNLVHQLVHIHHHLFYEGIGLRQLMDYYFILQKTSYGSTDSIKRSKKVIHQLGLDRFSCALMYVLQVVFGLERNKMLWNPSKKDGIFLLNEIMCSGNFGQADIRKKGIYQNKWKSFWYIHFKTFRYWRFDHWAWFWSPIYRIRGFVWRKVNGYN